MENRRRPPQVPPDPPLGRAAPFLPDRLPVYPEATDTKTRQLAGYFDAQGRPLVASAREVAPSADNPLNPLLRLGEVLAWKTIHGRVVWPQNARNNVLSYYLIGRRRGSVEEWLLATLPFLGMLALDVAALVDWYFRTTPTLIITQYVLGSALYLPVLFGVGALVGHRHVGRLQHLIPFEEIALTRIEPGAMLYGLVVRPLAGLHIRNLLYNLVSACFVVLATLYILGETAAAYGRATLLPTQVAGAAMGWSAGLGVSIVRGLLYALAINLGVVFGVRSRLFLRPGEQAALRTIKDAVGFLLEYGALVFAVFATLFTLAYAGVCCAFPLAGGALWWLGLFLMRLVRRAAIVVDFTVRRHSHWWMWNPEDAQELPEDLRTEW